MTSLPEAHQRAAAELAGLINDATPNDYGLSEDSEAYDAVSSLADFAIALAVSKISDIARELLAQRIANGIEHPPKPPEPQA